VSENINNKVGGVILEERNIRKQTASDDDEIDLGKLFAALFKRLPVIVLITVLFAAIGFSYAKFYLPLEYTASTYMYVKNANDSADKNAVNNADLQASQSLVETYIVILGNTTVVKQVGAELLDMYDADRLSECFSVEDGVVSTSELSSAISMAADGETEVLKLSAQTKDPEISAAICDIYADIAPDYLVRIVGAGSVEVIGEAEVPTSPSAPNIKKITMIAALVGLVLSAGIVVLQYLLDSTVRDEDDVQEFGVPYLGEVPDITLDAKGKKKYAHRTMLPQEMKNMFLYSGNLSFAASEAYRALRTNLMFSLAPSDGKIVAVTSPDVSNGKSTTAANTAMALAMLQKHVLLIDADMRKPVQHTRLQLKNDVGLSESLGQMADWKDAVQKDVADNMDVLTSGTCPPNPSELLVSPAMKKLLKEAEERYDYIIIDTPPVNVVSDVLGLANMVSGVMMILRYRTNTKKETEVALQNIDMAQIPILGIVLTAVNIKEQNQYYKRRYYTKSYDAYTNVATKPGTQTKEKSGEGPKKEPVEETKEEQATAGKDVSSVAQ
jgi:capsular exopolysaccharide synthesis family protein